MSLTKLLCDMWKYFWKFESRVHLQIVKICRILLGIPAKDAATIHDIKILHDSPHFLVIEKAPDVLMNTVDKNKRVTVERQLEVLYPDLVNPNLGFSFYFTHRLDYSTSGVLCVAKHRKAAAVVQSQFTKGNVQKYYLALVRGHLSQNYIKIDEAIGKDNRERFENSRMATASMSHCIHSTCRSAKTHLILLELGLFDNYPASKVLLRPVTGRRHQLRLHCHIIGHTIVGDYTYSNRRDISPYRMYLHAYKLIINNPLEKLNITTADPFVSVSGQLNSWESFKKVKSVDEGLHELTQSQNERNLLG